MLDTRKPKPRKKPSKEPPPNWRKLEFLSINEAAAVLRCSAATVLKLLHTGQLDARRVMTKVLVKGDSLASLVDEAQKWAKPSRAA